jgi:PAS domain S-box-containing protein
MTWLAIQERPLLETTLRHLECCILMSTVEGKILWANDSFINWSGYTLGELQSMTWMDLSVRDGSLLADTFEAKQLDGYQQEYRVRKQYIPKQQKPVWGTLNVLRYPAIGELKCCICTWHPIGDDSKEAYTLATEAIHKMSSELQKLSDALSAHMSQSLFESTIVSVLKLGIKYPKTAWVVFVTMVVVIGGNAGFELLLKVMSVVSPVKVAAPQ